MRVLHIEDRPENRRLVRKLLESEAIEVIDAADGLSGIELAQQIRPTLILLDINIPGLDGYEVVTKLKGDPDLATTPVVAITAEGDRDHALALGFDGFIVKPLQIGRFVAQLREFVAGRREVLPESERGGHLLDHNRRVVDRLETKVRELTRANERLRELDRLKMEVLRNVSHELATPLTPVMGYMSLLAAGELGPLTPKQKAALTQVDGSLGRLKGLIDNLLDVTHFVTGEVALERTVFEPLAMLRAVADTVSSAGDARGLTVEVVAPERGEPVIADRGRLEAALYQVVDNAIKFSPASGRVRITLAILDDGDPDRRLLELAVLDEGPGIPSEERERVVEPFYQIDGSVTRCVGGAGLGLAVADRTARLHGGRLVITRAPGGGARVALRVPLRPPVPGVNASTP